MKINNFDEIVLSSMINELSLLSVDVNGKWCQIAVSTRSCSSGQKTRIVFTMDGQRLLTSSRGRDLSEERGERAWSVYQDSAFTLPPSHFFLLSRLKELKSKILNQSFK